MPTELQSLYELARSVSAEHEHDEVEVTRQISQAIQRNKEWRVLALNFAALELAKYALRQARVGATHVPSAQPDRALSALKADMDATYDAILSFPLANGVPLRQATDADLAKAILIYDRPAVHGEAITP